MNTTHIFEIEIFCPKCNYKFNAHTGVNSSEKPDNKSISICLNCATILKFNPESELQIMSRYDLFILKIVAPEVYHIIMKVKSELEDFKKLNN